MRNQDPSDSRTDFILDSLTRGVIAADRSASITYLNAATTRTPALQPDTALGKPLARFFARQQERARAEHLTALGLIPAGIAYEVADPLAGLHFSAQFERTFAKARSTVLVW